jgi:antitoxin (DNA-binding transcriptional repressor) of toxin-antitoxin stability system
MLRTIDLNTTKIDLDSLLQEVQEGTEILLMNGNTPIARIVPPETRSSGRKADLSKGAIWTSDDFDEPLPDEFWLGEE